MGYFFFLLSISAKFLQNANSEATLHTDTICVCVCVILEHHDTQSNVNIIILSSIEHVLIGIMENSWMLNLYQTRRYNKNK